MNPRTPQYYTHYPNSSDTSSQHEDLESESTPLIYRPPTGRPNNRCFILTIIVIICLTVCIPTSLYIFKGTLLDRMKWDQELRQHRTYEEKRMNEWEQEFTKRQLEGVERQEREKKREEQWQREEEERERLGLYWDNPQGDAYCAGFNTRHYSARLMNTVSYNYNWLKPCLEIPLVIHGRDVKASRCEIQGSGIVYGHWTVDFDEPFCSAYWDQFKDKGCTADGSHYRRYEAHLEGVHGGENAEVLCASAPNDFKNLHFDHPTTCANWGKYGIFGIWIVEDWSC